MAYQLLDIFTNESPHSYTLLSHDRQAFSLDRQTRQLGRQTGKTDGGRDKKTDNTGILTKEEDRQGSETDEAGR
jgi:hypothetical protein